MAVTSYRQKWRVEIFHQGKRIYRKAGFKTKLEALNHEKEVKDGLKKINTTFIQLCESRLQELELKRTPQHFKENKAIMQMWVQRWGNKRITRDEIEAYLSEIANDSKPKANKHLRLLRALFNHGVKRGWITENPTQGVERYPESKKKRYIPPQADIEKVLALAKPLDRLYLLVIAHTLGRVRAVNNLKWEDIYDDYLILYTRKARNSDLKEIKIPINDVLKEVLKNIPHVGEYLFMNEKTKKPYDYRDKFLPNLCDKAGVKPFMYHAFRHFGASKLENLGVPITDIQKILGHERTTTTDHYLQSLRGGAKQAVKKLEDLK